MNRKIGFSALRKGMSATVRQWQDYREPVKKEIELHDVVLSGFACMFYQEPSLLQFQRELEDSQKNNNLRTQFDVSRIPSSTQMREVLDNVPSRNFESIFNLFHTKLEKNGITETFKNKLGTYYLPADGTQYYSSTKVHCKQCLRKECKNGTHYYHQMLQSAIVHPDKKFVIPLMPIEIGNAPDINPTKQDCEWKGFFRFLAVLKRSTLKKLPFTILLDALFADQVVVEAIRAKKNNFIIVSKPDDNKYLHEEFSLVTTKKEDLEVEDDKYVHIYQWSHGLPLNSKRKVFVNFIQYEMKKMKRPGVYETVYKNSWITDHEITKENAPEIVLGGRARWKIENECFNATKNQGYNLEHSYGHGEKFLSFNFIVLTMLSFFMHQFLESEELYQGCRKKFGSKKNLWGNLRAYIKLIIFDSFEWLLEFALNKNRYLGSQGLQWTRAGPELQATI